MYINTCIYIYICICTDIDTYTCSHVYVIPILEQLLKIKTAAFEEQVLNSSLLQSSHRWASFTVSCCVATRCTTLQHAATHSNTLQHTEVHCNKLEERARLVVSAVKSSMGWFGCQLSHWKTLHHTALHCNTLQDTATRCNTLKITATHCNTLQHAATHCNPLEDQVLDLSFLQ